jgi:hypothetical protein
MNRIPDQSLFQAGPVNITPRTLAGFAAGTALDPVTYTPAAAGKVLEALGPAARLARPAKVGIEAMNQGLGAVQGAELAGRDPETGEIDPGRAALGAVAGLGVQNVGHAIPLAKKAGTAALDTGLETMDRISPPSVAYANTAGKKKFYTGIGSRETPPEIQGIMTQIASKLNEQGFTLRSGAAKGADSAFEAGAGGNHEIYLPWGGYEGRTGSGYIPNPSKEAMDLAAQHHPNWGAVTQGARKLHARNSHQVLGQDLNSPSDFVLAWTPGGKGGGGTGQAIRLARAQGVKVFDLGDPAVMARMKKFVGLTDETGGVAPAETPGAAPPPTGRPAPGPTSFSNAGENGYPVGNQPVMLKDGTVIGRGYSRVIHGEAGDYVELLPEHVDRNSFSSKFGDINRPLPAKSYYRWLEAGPNKTKIYEQVKGVKYADYKPGRYYVDPKDLQGFDGTPVTPPKGYTAQAMEPVTDEGMADYGKPVAAPWKPFDTPTGTEVSPGMVVQPGTDPGPNPFAGRSYQDLSRDEITQANQWAKAKVAFDNAQKTPASIEDPRSPDYANEDLISKQDVEAHLGDEDNWDPRGYTTEQGDIIDQEGLTAEQAQARWPDAHKSPLGQEPVPVTDDLPLLDQPDKPGIAPDDGRPHKFRSAMSFPYNGKQRPGVTSKTTLEAITKGERTSTTRWPQHQGAQNWINTEPGDVVEVTGARGERIRLRVTGKNPIDLSKASPDELEAWSKAEGWSVEAGKNLAKNGPGIQVHYEYLGPSAGPDARPIYNEMGRVLGNPKVETKKVARRDPLDAKWQAEQRKTEAKNRQSWIDTAWMDKPGNNGPPVSKPSGYVAEPMYPNEFPPEYDWEDPSLATGSTTPPKAAGSPPPNISTSEEPMGPNWARLSVRGGGPRENLPPSSQFMDLDPEDSIYAQKLLAQVMDYESGMPQGDIFLEGEPPKPGEPDTRVPTTQQGFEPLTADEYLDEPMRAEGDDTRSPLRRGMVRQLAPFDIQEGGREGPPQIGPVGAVKGAVGAMPGFRAESEAHIGTGKAGDTAKSLEGQRYRRVTRARAIQLATEELARVGGDARKSHWYQEVLDNMIRAETAKYDKYGKPKPRIDPDTGEPMTMRWEGETKDAILHESFPSLVSRVADKEGKYKDGYGPAYDKWARPDTDVAGWENTPYGQDFLRKIARDILTAAGKNVGKSERDLAKAMIWKKAQEMATWANPDNMEHNVAVRRRPKVNKSEAAKRDDELSGYAEEDSRTLSEDATDEEIANIASDYRGDAHETDPDKPSYAGGEDDERSYSQAPKRPDPNESQDAFEYRELTRRREADRKYLIDLGNASKEHGYFKDVYDKKTGEPIEDSEGRRVKRRVAFSEEDVRKQIEATRRRIERATRLLSKMDVPVEKRIDPDTGELLNPTDESRSTVKATPTLKREGVPREQGQTVEQDTDYFKQKMREIIAVMERMAPGRGEFVEAPARKTWESYMQGRLQRLMQGQDAA